MNSTIASYEHLTERLPNLKGLPWTPLVAGATPLEAHAALTGELGVPVLVKREDRTDDLGCGHKLRKLQYIVAEALRGNCDVLVTAGSVPSNQCKAVAVVARRLGMRANLVYGGDRQEEPEVANGNYLLSLLQEPTLTWHPRTPWKDISGHMKQACLDELMAGHRPFPIEPGASETPGIWGSVEMGLELAAQLAERGVHDCRVFAVAGSGGGCVGLAIAASLLNLPWEVTGICIGAPSDALARDASALLSEASRAAGVDLSINVPLRFSDESLGAGYGEPTSEELRTVVDAMTRFGLVLDANYMVKAFLGMVRSIKQQPEDRRPVVLIHSGGQVGVFDIDADWSRWLQSRRRSELVPGDAHAS